jgi:uncharacterized damage-inducible protein DinB
MNSEDLLRYPIGKFVPQDSYTKDEVDANIRRIADIPSKIEDSIKNISAKQLDTPYREGGWTIRQVLHHISDSHLNAYIRFKWTLTEDQPVIKAYDEKAWAETPETTLDIINSLNLLKALHVKWVSLIKGLTSKDLEKEFIHPETKKHVSLARLTAMYAWHGEHHLGHILIVTGKKN